MHCSDGVSVAETFQIEQNHTKARALSSALACAMVVPWALCVLLYSGRLLHHALALFMHGSGSVRIRPDATQHMLSALCSELDSAEKQLVWGSEGMVVPLGPLLLHSRRL